MTTKTRKPSKPTRTRAKRRRRRALPSEVRAAFAGRGLLHVLPGGYGFLRRTENGYLPAPDDPYVSPAQIRRYDLRTGVLIDGQVRAAAGERSPALARIDLVNGMPPAERGPITPFDELTSLHPTKRLILETGSHDLNQGELNGDDLSLRVVDLVAPVGKGQRGLIVSPPRVGKTVLLGQLASAVARNHPESHLIVLLIDERPEEVTEMRALVNGPRAEVIASTFDRPAREHLHVAEMVLGRAQRLVEDGRDVIILLDSVTRLARAYNAEAPGGKLLSGGVAVGALDAPKRFFGAARDTEEAGSLTVLATALVDTGSRMDQVIFEEFKGTGNMELVLDRRLADRRVWPAVNLRLSGTRREELLLHPEEAERIRLLRRALSTLDPVEAMSRLTERLRATGSNLEFLLGVPVERCER